MESDNQIAEYVQISVSPAYNKRDTEIAETVLNTLKSHTSVPVEKIKIKVENGIVTLEGEAEWNFHRIIAKTAIEYLAGVRYVINLISLRPKLIASDIERKINFAFNRSTKLTLVR